MTNCPLPIDDYEEIQLAHGGGGKLMHQLLEGLVLPAFENEYLNQAHDGAVFEVGGTKLAFTTDSYVVDPLFFPGGDIGELAVHGTVNDLAMCGAQPEFLSAGLIIEEGFPVEHLNRVVESMESAAEQAGSQIVTGDTKVVERGQGDGLYVNTAGVGGVLAEERIGPAAVEAGDAIIVSGDVGRHGMAIMSEREGLDFESEITSDTAALQAPVAQLMAAEVEVHCLRDLTRGGLATNLNELARASELGIEIETDSVPVREDVQAACEILGLDPFYVACEGRMVLFVPATAETETVELLQEFEVTGGARCIGRVTEENPGRVSAESPFGSSRLLEVKSGAQLPRIC